jgi:hypothetical protein
MKSKKQSLFLRSSQSVFPIHRPRHPAEFGQARHLAAVQPDKSGMTNQSAVSKGNNMNTPVVLITGALTGIARATAFAFAKKGAKIVASGRHDDAGAGLVAELRAAGAEAEFVRASSDLMIAIPELSGAF